MRALGAAWLVAFLLWLPFEDTSVRPSLVLAAGGIAWLAIRMKLFKLPSPGRMAAAGAAAGLALPLVAITLMAFKGGAHGHGFADFTPGQVWQIVQLTPLAGLAGALLGFTWGWFAPRTSHN